MLRLNQTCVLMLVGFFAAVSAARAADFASHKPTRPLPAAHARPMEKGNAFFVDAAKGNDAAQGTEAAPWKTLARGVKDLKPGDTLVLRGGTYYETAVLSLVGHEKAPITIRAYSNELVVIDGGFREFVENPTGAWEPVADGAKGEFVSTGKYPQLLQAEASRRDVWVTGNFADSMIPLHGYHTLADLRSDNMLWKRATEMTGTPPERAKGSYPIVYCGPGVWMNRETKRIHIRLAPTAFAALGEDNYTGETDPRKLKVVINGGGTTLKIENAKHLRLQDLVIRGARAATFGVVDSSNIELDGLTVYGGSPAIKVGSTTNLKVLNTAARGLSTPWSFRTSEKYIGMSAYLFEGYYSGKGQNSDVEIANCEFTDSHDGLILSGINNLRFHHNLVHNFNDDCLYVTSGIKPGNELRIYQNYVGRHLSGVSFAGTPTGQENTTTYFYRNIIDMRQGVLRSHPFADDPNVFDDSRTLGTHGSPIFRPMSVYHNTYLVPNSVWRSYYAAGFTRAMESGAKGRIFNNIFWYAKGLPGFFFGFGKVEMDVIADGNLHWSATEGQKQPQDFLASARKPGNRLPEWFEASKKTYPPGWTANDQFADPKFAQVSADPKQRTDLRLTEGSPAINAGVDVSTEWPDEVRATDAGKPDIGALPAGVEAWCVGVHGRFNCFGEQLGNN